jgi:hypothetical protein
MPDTQAGAQRYKENTQPQPISTKDRPFVFTRGESGIAAAKAFKAALRSRQLGYLRCTANAAATAAGAFPPLPAPTPPSPLNISCTRSCPVKPQDTAT